MSNIYEKLLNIQTELKAPKGQFNSFGNYNYRSCEDIVEAVKPLCANNKCVLILSDRVVDRCEDQFVEATAELFDCEAKEGQTASILVTAYAKHPDEAKGMNASQITGSSSSYARKYACNGLFCIDDTKDADTDEFRKQGGDVAPAKSAPPKSSTSNATQPQAEKPKALPPVKF